MNYFSPCPLPADETVVSAWDSELRRIKTPWIEQILAEQGQELFQRFTSSYAELRALPRNARRALQRKLARSEDGLIPVEWRRRLAYSIAGAALLLALGQTVSEAAGPKSIKLSTKCTLGNAIVAVNRANLTNTSYTYLGCKASPGPATLLLAKGANLSYGASNPLPVITSQITIQGALANKPKKGQPPPPPGNGGTISGSGYSLFLVNGGNLTIQNVTLQGSYDTGVGAAINVNDGSVAIFDSVISGTAIQGGAIFNAGTLTLTRSTVSNSHADYGGGIYNVGNLTIANSTITGNQADSYSGGGIYNAYSATITNSTISNNTAAKNGGGIANSTAGTLSISSSTVTGNTAYKGGGIHNAQTLTVTSSTISNSTANYGGGLFNDDQADATLSGSTVSGNKASVFLQTNNIYYGGYGGGINNHGGLTINSSIISGNIADGKTVTYNYIATNYGGLGGGIFNASYVYLGNSSVTTNTAKFIGGGVYNLPPADGATLQPVNSTITNNSAPAGSNVYP